MHLQVYTAISWFISEIKFNAEPSMYDYIIDRFIDTNPYSRGETDYHKKITVKFTGNPYCFVFLGLLAYYPNSFI